MGIYLFIILVVVMLLVIGAGLVLIFRKPADGRSVSFVSPDNSVVKVRNVDGEIEVEFFPSETGDTEAFDLGEEVERQDLNERTLVEMWLDPDLSVEQRRELVRRMSVNGNTLVWTGDPDYRQEGEEDVEAGSGQEDGVGPEESGDPDDGVVEVEVDPVTLHSVIGGSVESEDEDYQDSADWGVACEAEESLNEGIREETVSDVVTEDEEDEVNERKRDFVKFMVDSYREGRLSRELLEYAQVRIGFIVDDLGWSVERLRKEKERVPVFDPDPAVAAMSLERFEMYVREVVSESMEAREQEHEAVSDPVVDVADVAEVGGEAGATAVSKGQEDDVWSRMEEDDDLFV